MKTQTLALVCSAALLAACGDRVDEPDDRIEAVAEASAAAAGRAPAALGLSEARLLEADLLDANRSELGSIEGVVRNADGEVDRLLVEIEDSNPDRFVEVPIKGLATVVAGNDTDVVTATTREQLAALPDAPAMR